MIGPLDRGSHVTVATPRPPRVAADLSRVEHDARVVSGAVVAGLAVGFVLVGWGSRLAMMLLARLNPQVSGRLSDDGFVMGTFDLGNTLGLVIFGTGVGVVGALLYLVLRPLRFGPTWFQWSGLTVGPAVIIGAALVHVDGVDFVILEPAWLAIGLFVVLPALAAAALVALVERMIADEAWVWRAPLPAALAPMAALLVVWPVAALAVIVWFVRQAARRPASGDIGAWQVWPWVGRAALVGLFGVALVDLVRDTLTLT